MNLVLWMEVPDELAENEQFMAILDRQAAEEAAALGKLASTRRVVESTEKPYHRLLSWDLDPRS